jgi:hypothetical protein
VSGKVLSGETSGMIRVSGIWRYREGRHHIRGRKTDQTGKWTKRISPVSLPLILTQMHKERDISYISPQDLLDSNNATKELSPNILIKIL